MDKEQRIKQIFEASTDYVKERGYFTGELDVPFIEGAEWADEHPNLTWKDIELIVNIDLDTNHEEVITGSRKNEEHYKEVLKRFLDFKEKKRK